MGDVNRVKALLRENPHLVSSKDDHWETPLHLAARSGHKEVVEVLLASKAEVSIWDKTGETPMLAAAARGHADVVKLLLDAGAKKEEGAVTVWAKISAIGPLRFSGTALVRAAMFDQADVVKLLLNVGADKEAKDAAGATALLRAAQGGHTGIVKLLLDAHANTEAYITGDATYTIIWHGSLKNLRPGWTFKGASHRSDFLTAEMTETNGVVYLKVSGRVHQSAIVLAARRGHRDIVKLLLDAGAKYSAHDEVYSGTAGPSDNKVHYMLFSASETALQAAIEGNHQDVADLLIAAGEKE